MEKRKTSAECVKAADDVDVVGRPKFGSNFFGECLLLIVALLGYELAGRRVFRRFKAL